MVDNYYYFIRTLSPQMQLELVERISHSLRENIAQKGKTLKHLYGAWKGYETAEELATEIRKARKFNRKIESL